jgi:uncharacterized protein with ParB-like and HNH nuclease domain
MSYFPPITISSAIQKIDYQQYLLPAIQREFVWKQDSIELLFDSLMRDYPIGSLLMWKVQGENKNQHRYYSVLKSYREKYNTHSVEVNTSNISDFEAILDGQQRLTALYLGLKGTYAFKRPRVVWKDNEYALPTRKLYLNLSGYANQDETLGEVNEDGRLYDFKFLIPSEAEADNENNWFEVGHILNLQGTFKLNAFIKKNGYDDDEFINETLSKLHDTIHVKPIIQYYLESDQDYEKALNIFIRINNGGEKLDYSDLIMSTIIAVWQSVKAREEFNSLIDEIWDNSGIVISKDLIIRTYLMIYSDDIKFRVTNFSVKNAKEFEDHWIEIRHAIAEAFQLIKDFGYNEHTMTSKNAVLPVIYYLYKTEKTKEFSKKVGHKDDRDIIKKWLHVVLLHRIFGGQADSVLKIIRDTISDDLKSQTFIFPAKEIAKRLSKTRKTLTVDDEFIENLLYTEYEDRYAFPILALLYPYLDYKNGDFHKDHIFPKSLFNQRNFKKAAINLEQERGKYYTDKWSYNGIVNLQLLDGNENKSKNDKSYEAWSKSTEINYKKLILPKIFLFSQFPDFVDKRWDMLFEKLKEALSF